MAVRSDFAGLETPPDAGTGNITLINVFEMDADSVDVFLDGWRRRAGVMATMPGFISAKLHRAISPSARFQLVNVSLWENLELYEQARGSRAFQDQIASLVADGRVSMTSTPAVYRVVVHETPAPRR